MVSKMLQDFVRAINLEFRQQIQWSINNHMVDSMVDFQCHCSLFDVVAMIDGIHFEI